MLGGLALTFIPLVVMELRELLKKYEFPGDDIPIVFGRSKEALENPTSDNDGSRSIDARASVYFLP